MKWFKRIAVFIICISAIVFFFGNTFINLIGVPIAAHQSYETWKMSNTAVPELTQDTLSQKTEIKKEP